MKTKQKKIGRQGRFSGNDQHGNEKEKRKITWIQYLILSNSIKRTLRLMRDIRLWPLSQIEELLTKGRFSRCRRARYGGQITRRADCFRFQH